MAGFLREGRNVILLSKERNVERCHRKVVATFISIVAGLVAGSSPAEVIHLD